MRQHSDSDHDTEAAISLWGADLLQRVARLDPRQEIPAESAARIRASWDARGLLESYPRLEPERTPTH